ncbi:glycerate dehydrogenase [Alteromonas ponticola]|uniref:Glycerate dehydrogenase n=1 Tax=Alteromonas aquimaris TaxID=2998417 RepID=A0ABT3P8U6_9ALTE|nr:NAD(P)-dependent oxidoreductase [Alteromonas aquimaris]MCW8108945.1 glycerate dehydrogenase [Alteromonas aquimaris]
MEKLTAVFLDVATLDLESIDVSALSKLNVNIETHAHTHPDEVVARIRHAHIIFTNKVKLSAQIMMQAPLCRYIGILATGTDNVDVNWCQRNGVTVRNVKNYGSVAVAQHTLTLLLNLTTSFCLYHHDVGKGRWSEAKQFCLNHHPVSLLAGKHAVLIGSGAIGNQVAKLFQALDMHVSFAARVEAENDPRPSLDSLLPTADVVSLHCPLTDATRNLINASRLSLLKPTAFLLNTARGELIDEGALLAALEQGRLAGAGLDVLSEEPPPPDHPLICAGLPNLLITPHCAWVANEARQKLFDTAIANLAAFLKAD